MTAGIMNRDAVGIPFEIKCYDCLGLALCMESCLVKLFPCTRIIQYDDCTQEVELDENLHDWLSNVDPSRHVHLLETLSPGATVDMTVSG